MGMAVIRRLSGARRLAAVAAVAVAAAAAACGPGPAAPATPAAATAGPSVAASDPAPSTAGESIPTDLPGPPLAALSAGSVLVDGALGTFTWGGGGSDAPWIVPPAERAIADGGPFSVTFTPPIPVERWTMSWAPITAEGAGSPTGGLEGTGPLPAVGPVPGPGPWSLAVRAWFGAGREATWFWRVDQSP